VQRRKLHETGVGYRFLPRAAKRSGFAKARTKVRDQGELPPEALDRTRRECGLIRYNGRLL